MMEQLMGNWGQQLKSKDASPNPSLFEMPALVKSSATDPVSELMRLSEMTLVPLKIWLSATEAWQRAAGLKRCKAATRALERRLALQQGQQLSEARGPDRQSPAIRKACPTSH
jgi:hypothetical protein